MSVPPIDIKASDHLLRSDAQIARVLESLAARREVVTAELPGNRGRFTGRVIHADSVGQFITVSSTDDESARAALLGCARVPLSSRPGGWNIEFVAVDPCEVMHDGTPAIRLGYPDILSAHQRRQHVRHDVPTKVPLRCVADASGLTPFDAHITDISRGGIGVLHYSPDITLEPGTVLLGSHIEGPGGDSIAVNLQVRYSEMVTLPDGSSAHRSGFCFVNASDDVQRLIDAYDSH